jgi:hypothetical protein
MRSFVLLILAILPTMVAAHASDVHPPFGLRWGESETEIEGSIAGAGGQIVAKGIVQGRETWTVDGLTQPALQHALFSFGTEHTLVEVELQYARSDWGRSAFDNFFTGACQRFDAHYGRGTVLVQDRSPQGEVTQTLTGYEWRPQSGLVQVFLFSAERRNQLYATVSVHYQAN